MQDLEIAKGQLTNKKLTLCVVKEQEAVFESRSHGVAGFMEAVERLEDKLEGSSVADKVVGKAVALLCVYAKVKAVYATTLSKTAETLLAKNSVYIEYEDLVESILGADRLSVCPFEQLVREIMDPIEAYRKLKSVCHSKGRLKPLDEKA